MNIFQIIPSTIFIEDEKDLNFIKTALKQNGIIYDVKIGCAYKTEDLINATIKSIDNQNIYVVKPLDTINSISKKLNIEKEVLIKLTGGTSLFIGQKIRY